MARRAGLIGFFTLLSRLTGLVRDVAIAHAFGTRLAADAFFVAFRIPNLLRRLFAEGALTVSFVPIFTQSLKASREEAKRVVNTSFTLMLILLIGVSLLGILLSPWLVRLTAWGFTDDPEKYRLTVSLTRVMFPYILFVSLAALAMGILNSVKHFAAPAAASIFMNLGVIAGALWLGSFFDPPVMGLAVGVLLGGLLQLAIHFPYLKQFGFWPRLQWDPSHPAVKGILRMMIPAAYGAAVYQFHVILITFLASFLTSGSVSYLWYADRVMEFPLGIFAISIATAILPTLSDQAADKDHKALKETFGDGLRMIFFITLPAAGGLIVLAEPIIRILFQHGTFGEASTTATSQALVFFTLGLPFISGVRITSNAFYALQDSRTPVRAANWSILVNLVLSLVLMGPLQHNGLALAVSLASAFNFLMQLADFRKKVGLLGLRRILKGTLKSLAATIIMMGLLWMGRHFLITPRPGTLAGIFELLVEIGAGIGLYLLAGWTLRIEELRILRGILRAKKKYKI